MSRNPYGPRWGLRIAAIVATLFVVFGGAWFVFGYWWDVSHVMWSFFVNDVWRAWLFPNGWNLLQATPFFWFIVVAVASFAAYAFVTEYLGRIDTRALTVAITSVGVVWAMFAGYSMFAWSDWNARHYNSGTTYVVSDSANLPNSLARVESSGSAQVDIVDGKMPNTWVHRKASATGATYVIRKTGDSNSNTELMGETLAYIYDKSGDGGSWTGIRNGKNRQPLYGVASWSGTGETIKNCQFKGNYELDKAFGGSWGMNLDDDIKAFDPNFIYAGSDVYGYCDGDKPVIVIPGAGAISNHVQTSLGAYGVMTITGTPSGEPNIEFRKDVRPGDLPGPAYPVNLVAQQRDALSWSAGRVWPWQPPVGFETADGASQEGNSSDFLLKSKDDGRLYWVTPLKPLNTDSQTIVAYAMVAADEMTQGKFNPQRVYVLNDGDIQIVNFNDLENAVTQAVAKEDPGFFTGAEENRGQIVEFTPTGVGTWQVFGERGGRAVYQIDVTGGARMHTNVIRLDVGDTPPATPTPAPSTGVPTSSGNCDNPAKLSDAKIAECIGSLSGELSRRYKAANTAK